MKLKFFTTVFLIFGFSSAIYAQTVDQPASDSVTLSDTLIVEPDIPVIFLSYEDIEGDAGSYDISSLLQGTRDIYVSTGYP